jgi:hypothetical protein
VLSTKAETGPLWPKDAGDERNGRREEKGLGDEGMAMRKTLLKYKLHQEQDLFDRAYEYIKQYY